MVRHAVPISNVPPYHTALLVLEPSLAHDFGPSQLALELDGRLSVRTSNEACIASLIPAHLPLAFTPCHSAPYNGPMAALACTIAS